MKEINKIKSNINFIYATGTSSVSAEEAANNAKDLISLEIEQWLKDNSKEDIAGYVAKSKENLSQIKTKRGNLYRVFVFVRKKDILPYYKTEDVMVVDIIETKQSEVANDDSSDITAAETSETTLRQSNFFSKGNENTNIEFINNHSYSEHFLSTKEKKMLSLKSRTALNKYYNQDDVYHNIIQSGTYKNLPTLGKYYVFIYDTDQNIRACIKKEDLKLVNMATGKEDSFENYKGCGVIWIQFKQE